MARSSETLAKIPLFGDLPPAVTDRLDTQCIWRNYDPKEQILHRNEPGTEVYFVASGIVRVLIHSPKGKEVILRDIKAGEFFGELAALDGRPRSAGIVALTRSIVAKMPAAVFRAAIHAHETVRAQILELLTTQVRQLSHRVAEFSTLSVNDRIRAELLRLARRRNDRSGEFVISPPPYHSELAARVSTHREAVTRELRDLERRGLLEKRRGALVIRDPDRLNDLIGGP
ncbi:MAG: Crp/Fnr family transcriptional regulator [Alphaproteobacteria bacterium]|nr:Crp/Fnr family transcriptional regulator [Alphaproteobacteria bacterium]